MREAERGVIRLRARRADLEHLVRGRGRGRGRARVRVRVRARVRVRVRDRAQVRRKVVVAQRGGHEA